MEKSIRGYILMGINYDSTSYITNESSPHVAGGKEKRRKKKTNIPFFKTVIIIIILFPQPLSSRLGQNLTLCKIQL